MPRSIRWRQRQHSWQALRGGQPTTINSASVRTQYATTSPPPKKKSSEHSFSSIPQNITGTTQPPFLPLFSSSSGHLTGHLTPCMIPQHPSPIPHSLRSLHEFTHRSPPHSPLRPSMPPHCETSYHSQNAACLRLVHPTCPLSLLHGRVMYSVTPSSSLPRCRT